MFPSPLARMPWRKSPRRSSGTWTRTCPGWRSRRSGSTTRNPRRFDISEGGRNTVSESSGAKYSGSYNLRSTTTYQTLFTPAFHTMGEKKGPAGQVDGEAQHDDGEGLLGRRRGHRALQLVLPGPRATKLQKNHEIVMQIEKNNNNHKKMSEEKGNAGPGGWRGST